MYIAITKYLKPLAYADKFRPLHHLHILDGIANKIILSSGRLNATKMNSALIISQTSELKKFEQFMLNDPFYKENITQFEIHSYNPKFYAPAIKTIFEQQINQIELPKDDDLDTNTVTFLQSLPPLNVFRMLAYLPKSLPPFINLVRSILNEAKFPIELHEIGILRVAHLNKSAYQWQQHTHLAKANNITEAEIEIIRSQSQVTQLSEEKNFACQVADEITQNADISPESFNRLFTKYQPQAAMEYILCLSFYNMLSRFLKATRVPLETNNHLDGMKSPTGK